MSYVRAMINQIRAMFLNCGSVVAVQSEEMCRKILLFGLTGLSMEKQGEFFPIGDRFETYAIDYSDDFFMYYTSYFADIYI